MLLRDRDDAGLGEDGETRQPLVKPPGSFLLLGLAGLSYLIGGLLCLVFFLAQRVPSHAVACRRAATAAFRCFTHDLLSSV